jgi:hypothetical protein
MPGIASSGVSPHSRLFFLVPLPHGLERAYVFASLFCHATPAAWKLRLKRFLF